jgi:hypothetical protein
VYAGTADNRQFGFVPAGWGGRAIVVVNIAKVEWSEGPDLLPMNPLAPGELESEIKFVLLGLGAEVVHTWNGHPGITGSLALARPAHPSLLAAVQRYRAGCPRHPGPLCSWDGCAWYSEGNAKVVQPALTAGQPL